MNFNSHDGSTEYISPTMRFDRIVIPNRSKPTYSLTGLSIYTDGLKMEDRHGSRSLLCANRNGIFLQVGWDVKCFSGRYFCDHESDRID